MKVLRLNRLDHTLSSAELIRRILDGEKELYEMLIRRNNQKLFRVVRSYIQDPIEIQDIMQNTYLKAYEKLYQFKQNSKYSTWLIRIGINEALSRIKEKGKYVKLNSPLSSKDGDTVPSMHYDHTTNPEKQLLNHEAHSLIERAIDTLAPKYKLVFILKEIEGLSIQEISESLDLSSSNVKVRLHRAKAMLKDKLLAISTNRNLFEFGSIKCDRLTQSVMSKI